MLRITLHDGERAIVNGAMLKAVGRTQLCIENKASILRGREVMPPEEATTPARKLYLACMLAYIDPEHRVTHQDTILEMLRELLATLPGDRAKAACARFANDIAHAQYYRAISSARDLIAYEADAHSTAVGLAAE